MDNSSLEDTLNDSEKLLRQIMARNKDSMMKMSYMQLQNKEMANVAVSNIFMVVYKRLYKYPGIEKEKAWICAIAVKEWRRQLRRKAFGLRPLIRIAMSKTQFCKPRHTIYRSLYISQSGSTGMK